MGWCNTPGVAVLLVSAGGERAVLNRWSRGCNPDSTVVSGGDAYCCAEGIDELSVGEGLLSSRSPGASFPAPDGGLIYPTSSGDLSDGQVCGLA